MASVLVYVESQGGEVSKSSLSLITAGLEAKAAHGYDKVVAILMGGAGTETAANSLSTKGLDEIRFIESSALEQYLAPVFSDAFVKVAREVSPGLILAPASSRGKDFIPRVAFSLDAPQASDVISFSSEGSFIRPMYAGNIIAEVELEGPIKVATIRQSAFDAPPEGGSNTASQKMDILIDAITHTEFVSFDTVKSERPELGDADIVISGGRALGSAENFEKLLYPLADHLGAALGASRAAVDSGFAPNDWQVGQTGKIVAPKLYIAIGISGAVQHLAGMKDSKVIVAINKDAEAPIFEVADYGLVGDLFELVPELEAKLKSLA